MPIKGEHVAFLGSGASASDAVALILGAPFDGTTSFTPGTRFGPNRIREASIGLETYSPALDRSLEHVPICDLGDLELPFGDVPEALEQIEGALRSLMATGAFPVLLGGEHLVTLPAVRACHSLHRDLAVVQLDAHADLRDAYLGQEDSHATVMRRSGEVVGPDSVFQIGIRSGTREEFAFGRARSGGFVQDVLEGARSAAERLRDRPVYLTIDIDVVDPAFAPGTGTPEPGGCSSSELLEAMSELLELNVVAMDVVEVNPMVDIGFTTSILGAKVVREGILMFADKRGESNGW